MEEEYGLHYCVRGEESSFTEYRTRGKWL